MEKQKRDSAHGFNTMNAGAEIGMETIFSFDSDNDSDWNEVIPSRGDRNGQDADTLLSDRLMQSYIQADQQPRGE